MRRILCVVAALAIPASAASLALTSGPASAASGPKGKSTCSTVSGSTSSGLITISGCVDSAGANTGGGTPAFPFSTIVGGGTVTFNRTVTFNSGKTMTFSAPLLANWSASHCPGYVKNAASNPTAVKFQGTVTASTAGLHLVGKIIGEVCIGNDTNGTITALKPLRIS